MDQPRERTALVDGRLLQAFATLFVNFNKVETFRTTTKDLLAYGEQYFEEKMVRVGKEEVDKPEWRELSGVKALEGLPGLRDLIMRMTAERAVRVSQQVIDSAALVFAHTVLDGTLSECCSLSFEAEPADWFQFVEKCKIEVGDLKTTSPDDVWRQKTLEFINQLKRESMGKRFDRLHKVCVPRVKGEPLITSWIEREQLDAFDQVRQRVIHVDGFAQSIPGVEEQVMFAALVGTCTLALVGKAHGLNAGGLLDKDPADREAVLSKVSSGVLKDFPKIEEQLSQWTNTIEHFNKLLAEIRGKEQ